MALGLLAITFYNNCAADCFLLSFSFLVLAVSADRGESTLDLPRDRWSSSEMLRRFT